MPDSAPRSPGFKHIVYTLDRKEKIANCVCRSEYPDKTEINCWTFKIVTGYFSGPGVDFEKYKDVVLIDEFGDGWELEDYYLSDLSAFLIALREERDKLIALKATCDGLEGPLVVEVWKREVKRNDTS